MFFALLCIEVRAWCVASDVFVEEAVEEHLAVVVVAKVEGYEELALALGGVGFEVRGCVVHVCW